MTSTRGSRVEKELKQITRAGKIKLIELVVA